MRRDIAPPPLKLNHESSATNHEDGWHNINIKLVTFTIVLKLHFCSFHSDTTINNQVQRGE